MRIIINSAHQRFGGAIQVALSFLYECRGFPKNEYYVWVGPGVAKSLQTKDFSANFHFSFFDFGKIDFGKTQKINRILREEEQKIKPNAIISTSGPTYFHSQAPQIIGFNLPLYIYPESPYVKGWLFPKKIKMCLKKLAHFYYFRRDASAFVVQTDDVNERVRKVLRTKEVHTVTNTYNHFYHNWNRYPRKLHPKTPDVFRFLTVSSWYPHKNLDIIPEVQRILHGQGVKNVEFVLTLKSEDFIDKVLKGKTIAGVHNNGPIAPEECPSLYDECDAIFMPTLAECFSASYPEAMIMGKPIITTDLGFARSICGEAALFFTPQDPRSGANSIIQLINNPQLKYDLISKGKLQLNEFDTAFERAKKYLALCEMISKKRST
ncbi:glycosyltransferase [Phaeodactylibacter xiamenensis]|uniref:glycosyltransferase n=1 Tax=Phaeodactylibacter xiamenensis TaxID=1524460 RepID=UPI003BA92548